MTRRRDGAEYLFSDYDLGRVCESQRSAMKKAIDDADAEAIRTADLDSLISGYVGKFALDVPELAEGAISVDLEEAQVDVSHDQMRFIRDRSRPFHVAGIRATYFVPFRGDHQLFKCQPGMFTNVTPAVTELRDDELVFVVERPDQDVGATKAAFESDLRAVKEYLERVRRDAEQFNASLPNDARAALAARRERLSQMDQGVKTLGIPIRNPVGNHWRLTTAAKSSREVDSEWHGAQSRVIRSRSA